MFAKVGVLFNQRKGRYSVNGNIYEYEQGALVDVQWGIENIFVLNAIYVHPDNRKVLHEGQTTDTKGTYGVMLDLPLFDMDQGSWAIRLEWLRNDRTNSYMSGYSGNDSELSKTSLGYKTQIDEFLSLKATADYFTLNVGENGRDNQWLEGAIAAIYEF